MEGEGNFRSNYNYLFNSYDRLNLSGTVDPPGENQSMFLAGNQQYTRNPMSSSSDMGGPQLQIDTQQSNYYNVNNSVNYGIRSINYLEQSKKLNQFDLRYSVGNIDNSYMQPQSIAPCALSDYRMQDSAKSSNHGKSTDQLLNICEVDDTSAGTLKCCKVANVKVEPENDLEDTENNKKDQVFVSINKSGESKSVFKNDSNVTIKEEALSDEESAGTESHEDNSKEIGELSDASTIIEDNEEITDKLLKTEIKIPDKFKGKFSISLSKTPRKQKSPKLVLPKVNKEYTCDTCSKVVKSERALMKHKNLHTEKFKCNDCNKIFNSAESLKNHSKVHAGFIGNEVCNVCDKTFYDKSSLKKHTLSVHMGITNFQCEYCHMSFFARKTYDEHVRVHTGEKPFKCSLCPKAYKRVADLNHHIRLHKGEVSHTCEKCGEGFRRQSELNRHMNTKHSDDSSRLLNNISKEKKCQLCNLAFSTLKALNEHLSSHNHLEDMIYKVYTKPAPSSGPVTSLDENSILTNALNSTQNWSNISLPRLPLNIGSQRFLDQKMSTSVLDMTYKNMMQAGANKQQQSTLHEENDFVQARIEEETSDINKNKTSVNYAQKLLERVDESSNSSIDNFEEEFPSNEIDIRTVGIVSVTACKAMDVGEVQVKSEIEDNFIGDDTEIEIDNYDADTDVEDYKYVLNVTDNMKSDINLKKFDESAGIKVETSECGLEGIKKSDYDDKKNSDIEPKVDKVSKRKATKPRKKVQKKKIVKQEGEDQELDADDLNPENEENNKEYKEKMKQNITVDDESIDLDSLKCLLCGKTFAKKITLKLHMHIHRGTYTCKICGKCFATNNSLKTHIDNHEGRKLKTAVCKVCDKVFYDASSLNKHVKTVHMDYRPHSCTVCDRRFSEPKTLNEHMRVHTGERPFACEVCGKTFKRTSELNFHIRKHNGEVNLNCSECGKGFIRMGQLRHHMMLKHDTERPFRCFICRKTFSSIAMLKDHRKMHVILKKHVCPKCGHKFHSKSKLGKHLRRKTDCQTDIGFKDGKFVCKYCYQEFFKIEERYAHMQEAHQTSEERKHSCEICGKLFRRSQALKIHLKIHYQVRDFKCTMCNAAFIQRHHLKQHIATHTGSRPYQCTVCLKSFAHSATLYNHMKHH